jgi:hypothetical protein
MRKVAQLGLIIANTVLALALAAPIASADNLSDAQAELRKDTRQMNEARRAGDRKGVQNERREIRKDRAQIARYRAENSRYSRTLRHHAYSRRSVHRDN